jgi:hypothetical protein
MFYCADVPRQGRRRRACDLHARANGLPLPLRSDESMAVLYSLAVALLYLGWPEATGG